MIENNKKYDELLHSYDEATNRKTISNAFKASISEICEILKMLDGVKNEFAHVVQELDKPYELYTADHFWRRLCQRMLNIDTEKFEKDLYDTIKQQHEMFGKGNYEINKDFSVGVKSGVIVTLLFNDEDRQHNIDFEKHREEFFKKYSK